MPLKLQDWGEILIDIYKAEPHSSFYISTPDLIKGARRHDPAKDIIAQFERNCQNNIGKENNRTCDQQIIRNFLHTIIPKSVILEIDKIKPQKNPAGRSKKIRDVLALRIKEIWQCKHPGADLCALAFLIYSCEANADRTNDFSSRFNNFLNDRNGLNLGVGDIDIRTPFFKKESGIDLIGLVDKVNNTCKQHDISLSIEIKQTNNTRWSGTIMSQCLINGTLKDRIKRIFGLSGMIPVSLPSDEELLRAFRANWQRANIPASVADSLSNEKKLLLRAMRTEFSQWDGSVYINEGESRNLANDRRRTESGETIESILLGLYPPRNPLTNIPEVKAFLYSARKESGERFYNIGGSVETIRLYRGQSQSIKSLEPTLIKAFNGEEISPIHDTENMCRAEFKIKDFYILKNDVGIWIETPEPHVGSSYLLLVREDKIEAVKEWTGNLSESKLESPAKGYILKKIESLARDPYSRKGGSKQRSCFEILNASYTFNDDKILVPDNDCLKVEVDRDVFGEDTSICITSEDHSDSFQLKHDDEGSVWRLDLRNALSTSFDKSRKWELYINSVKKDEPFIFGDYRIAENIITMGLGFDGEIIKSDEGDVCLNGLALKASAIEKGRLSHWQVTNVRGEMPSSCSRPVVKAADLLLYELSLRSDKYLSMSAAKEIAMRLFGENCPELWLLFERWFAMGYINMGFADGKKALVTNSPTMVMLLPESEEVNDGLNRRNPPKNFSCILTGARDAKLIDSIIDYQKQNPKNISIHFEDQGDDMPVKIVIYGATMKALETLSEALKIDFPKCVYSAAMLSVIPDVADYAEYSSKEERRQIRVDGDATQQNVEAMCEAFRGNQLHGNYKTNIQNRHLHPGVAICSTCRGNVSIIIQNEDHEGYIVGRNWGTWIEANKNQYVIAKIEDETLVIPGAAPLPPIVQRALCLISGNLPVFDKQRHVNIYRIPYNPTESMKSLTYEGIMKKLGQ